MQPNTKRTLQEDKTVTSFFHQAENQETSKWSLKNLIDQQPRFQPAPPPQTKPGLAGSPLSAVI